MTYLNTAIRVLTLTLKLTLTTHLNMAMSRPEVSTMIFMRRRLPALVRVRVRAGVRVGVRVGVGSG